MSITNNRLMDDDMMGAYVDDFYDYIMGRAEAEAEIAHLKRQAQHDWELEQD